MILQITNKEIFLNQSVSIPIEKTNIPFEHLHFRNRPGKEIYFEGQAILQGEILAFIPENYFAEKSNFEKQILPTLIPNKIKFENLIWSELEKHLTCYRKDAISSILKEEVKK